MPSSEVFPGALAPMPEPTASAALMWPDSEQHRPPRFVDGFERFEAFARDAGADPAVLANDLMALWDFVATHPALLDAPETADAAARFLGNAIAMAHPAATWRITSEPEVGTSTMSVPVAGLVRTIVEHPGHRAQFRELIASWPQADLDDQETSALSFEHVDIELVVTPEPYTRPTLTIPEFVDDAGQVIDYGSRWGGGSPPDDAYSRVSHLERFAPALPVIDALVDHLETWYDVDVVRRSGDMGALIVQLRPTTGAEITLTAAATGDSIDIEAGALFRKTVPDCTCDACDESAETVAQHLEETLLAIAAGGLREVFPVGRRRWVHTRIHLPDGTGGSSNGEPDHTVSSERLAEAEHLLECLAGGWWPAWSLRTVRR